MRAWHGIQLVFGMLAAVAAVLCWRLVTSLVRTAHKSKAITSKTARTPSCV